MRQAVEYILVQAIQYSPEQATLTIALKRVALEDGEEIVLDVRDHGPGIAPEDQPYVFDYMAHWDVGRQAQGTNLGTALARRIAEAHDGTVTFSTAPDAGTTFSIHLPLTTTKLHDTPSSQQPPASA